MYGDDSWILELGGRIWMDLDGDLRLGRKGDERRGEEIG